MITYRNILGIQRDKDGNPLRIGVYLAGKKVGTICRVKFGWQYWPVKSDLRGEVLPTLEAVKRSLEAA